VTKLLDDTLYSVEKAFERDSVKRGVKRYKRLAADAERRGDGASLGASARLLAYWFKAYCKAIRKERRACEAGRVGVGRGIYGDYMRLLDSDKTTLIAMHTALGMCLANPAGISTTKIVLAIGRNLSAQTARRRFRRKDREPWNALMHTDRKQIKPKGILKVSRVFFPEEVWPLRVQGKIGGMLLKLLINTTIFPDAEEVFHFAFDKYTVHKGRRTYYYLRLTDAADKRIRDAHIDSQTLHPRYQPMVVPPIVWTQDHRGGYLSQPTDLIMKLRGRGKAGELLPNPVLAAVNILNATPWRINKRILAVAKALRDQGGNVPGIPRMTDIPRPPRPADFETNPDAKKAWKKAAAMTYRDNVNLKGERKVAWHKLDIAGRFQKYDRIWFPHILDFRGRAYAIPQFLNHQGDDLCRGLLEFGAAKPINGNGAREWLDLHMANCCGYDKTSIEDRLVWIKTQQAQFIAWNADPLENMGWLEMDEPFQALAAAFAMFDSDAAAHLPIQVDGSNNALQHYGAMLRCPETAALANLTPAEAPQDAYEDVAVRARQIIARDAEAGKAHAIALEGWVTRKIVKQPVMTSVYGVTPVGARKQVHAALKKVGFESDELYAITKYLSQITLEAFAGVCVAAQNAMEWIRACGQLIVNSGQPIRWYSPIGLRIEEHYRVARHIEVRTILHRLLLAKVDASCPVHRRRQVNGFAPSFVHSIDASHLMRTAIKAHNAVRAVTIAFAGVHDAFWTHLADMDDLSRIIRETFVELHSTPLLDDLYGQLKQIYPAIIFPPPPTLGTFDLADILTSEYFFS